MMKNVYQPSMAAAVGGAANMARSGNECVLDAADRSVKIGNLKLEVRVGDITQEKTDAIVNSTNERLDLTIGR